MLIKVLGSAAGGGFPQWNCLCPVCELAWKKDPRVRFRTQSSLAITADKDHWLMLNASPDLRQQILETPELHPRAALRHSPIFGVFITNGDVDHIAGLLTLREQQPLTIFASPAILAHIPQDSVFGVLNPALVRLQAVALDETINVGFGLVIMPFAVPGKVPLYSEGAQPAIGLETESTIGLEISCDGRRVFYIPGCARITAKLKARISCADAVFFDGTTFTDDEMPRLGLSQKTAWRMGHVAMSGPDGSLVGLADVDIARKIYVHINNSNPVLVEDSPQRQAVAAAGWDVAHDGMEIAF